MVRKYIKIIILPAFFLLLSCTSRPPVIESFNGAAQGTTYSVVYVDNRNFDPSELKKQMDHILGDFDMSLSLYKDSSILCRINRNEDVKPDKYFVDSFKKSAEISRMTGGAFDVTVGPLVRAWGFGVDEHKNFTESQRDSLLRLIGMEKVSLTDGRIVKADTGIKLDFNAIAQGYSVDVVCDYLKSKGLKNYLVEIGGEVRAVGKKGEEKWRIGIDRPEEDNFTPGADLEAVIKISNESLATSGNYRKFYVENGIKYSHTINPKTGYPAKNNLLSATILASDCATADGIATACMVMGKNDAISFIGSHPEFKAFFVYSDEKGNFRTWLSPELKDMISDIQDN